MSFEFVYADRYVICKKNKKLILDTTAVGILISYFLMPRERGNGSDDEKPVVQGEPKKSAMEKESTYRDIEYLQRYSFLKKNLSLMD